MLLLLGPGILLMLPLARARYSVDVAIARARYSVYSMLILARARYSVDVAIGHCKVFCRCCYWSLQGIL